MSKIKCLACGEILESKFRHDFVTCGCDNHTFIDGGEAYMRCGGIDMSKIGVFPNWEPITKRATKTVLMSKCLSTLRDILLNILTKIKNIGL